jgi:hypothetical protein
MCPSDRKRFQRTRERLADSSRLPQVKITGDCGLNRKCPRRARQLVENVPHDVKIAQAWIGDGSLKLPVADGEEISDLAPLRTGKGVRASMAYTVDDLKTLKDLTK